jgi:FlaA1/EpsC-like NDP-sugar epimerase
MANNRYLNKLLIMLTDVIVIYVSIVLAYYMRILFSAFVDLIPLTHGLFLYLSKWWIPCIVVGSIGYHRGYGMIISFWDDCLMILKSLFMSFLIVWVVFSMQKEAETVSRIIITTSFVLMLILILISRDVIKFVLYKIMDFREYALIFEKEISKSVNTLKVFLNKEWYSGYKIVDHMENSSSVEKKIDALFLPMEYADDETVKKLKPNARDLIIVSEMSGLSFMNTEIKTFLDKNIALIATTNGLLLRNKVFLKRVFDLAIAILALSIFFPLFLIIPMFIKLDSSGPVYFKH